MQKFFEDMAKNASNPQALFQQFAEANKLWTETVSKQVAPAVLKNLSEAPQKAVENLKVFSDLNTKYATEVQNAAKAVPFDSSAFIKATVDYQKSLFETNTAIFQGFYQEVTEGVKAVTPKTK